MLPFLLKTKPQTGVIIKTRSSDASEAEDTYPKEDASEIETCAKDLLDALEAKNIPRIAEALKSAFAILESRPHEEYSENEQEG